MKKVKSILATLGVMSMALFPFVGVGGIIVAQADDTPLACGTRGGEWVNGLCTIPDDETTSSAQSIIKKIINIVSWVVGVIAVIMIIIAGLRYVTSGGQEKGVTGAKNTIMYAIIGLVVVALAQVIVRFVITNVGDGTTTG